ncbi:MAG: transketolase family protein [Thermoguttaceae bacterium]
MEILSRVHAKNLVRWAKDRPNVLVLSADLTSSTEIDLFKDAYPDRFISLGVAEQNMLSFAGGLAREGFLPFIHTFAVFIYRRAYDQMAMSVAYPNLPVRMFGFLPGITSPGGASHQAIEDIAMMRSLPNMTVVEVADATEIETVLDAIDGVPGPVYVRMLRGEVPRLFDPSEPMQLGKLRTVGNDSPGGQVDLTIFSSGICTEEAMRATQALRHRGVSIRHLHVSTHKPLDSEAVLEAVAAAQRGVITMENHVITGGLGSAVAEVVAEAGVARRLVRIGLRDTFVHGASRSYLMKEYGLDASALVRESEELLHAKFGISDSDLAAVRIEAVHSDAKAEAL